MTVSDYILLKVAFLVGFFDNPDGCHIDGGAGNDSIYNYAGDNCSLYGGNGNDYISLEDLDGWKDPDDCFIDGGDGNDTIRNYNGDDCSIMASRGDDYVYLNDRAEDNVFIYNNDNIGDGNDTLGGFDNDDTIRINGGGYWKETIGNDLKLHIGDGSILIWNYKDTKIEGTEIQMPTKTEDKIEPIVCKYVNKKNEVIQGSDNNDSLKLAICNKVTVYAGAGNDTIDNSGSDDCTIYGGTGDDSIIINAVADNNTFIYDIGDGNDTLDGFNSNDTIKINGGGYLKEIMGDDLKLSIGDGSILIKDYKDTKIEGTEILTPTKV